MPISEPSKRTRVSQASSSDRAAGCPEIAGTRSLAPDPLPPTVQELLREDDPFRLVIRAHAEIEQLVAMATQSVFLEGKMPEELKHLGFARTLSLAISLGLVPPEAREARPTPCCSAAIAPIVATGTRAMKW